MHFCNDCATSYDLDKAQRIAEEDAEVDPTADSEADPTAVSEVNPTPEEIAQVFAELSEWSEENTDIEANELRATMSYLGFEAPVVPDTACLKYPCEGNVNCTNETDAKHPICATCTNSDFQASFAIAGEWDRCSASAW
jgi:hypothetical protein